MAEMQTAEGGGHKKGKKVRSKKMSTRIDFTPMVDLGFLLITFFMLTTTLQKPQTMQIFLPEKEDNPIDQPKVKESKVLTLLLGKGDKVYWYRGITKPVLDSTDFSAEGVRKVILKAKDDVKTQWGMDTNKDGKETSHLVVLIKPDETSVYKNVVDALDEMAICNVTKSVLVDISKAEQDFIKFPEKGLNFAPETEGGN